jgi:hypothetical protein
MGIAFGMTVAKLLIMLMTIVLFASGLICFGLFYKAIDFFDKI